MRLHSKQIFVFLGLVVGVSGIAFTGFDRSNSSFGRSRTITQLNSIPRCYRFISEDSPENLPASELEPIQSTWCYQDVQTTSGRAQLIFNADSEQVRLEESALVYEEGDFSHGSLAKGEVTVHRSHINFLNPLPVPLRETELNEAEMIAPAKLRKGVSTEQMMSVVNKLNITPARVITRTITEGTIDVQLPDAKLPYGAYWWPHNGLPLSSGADSPLGKYDRYITARTGVDPKSRDWETQYHSLQHVPWGGHCNGWAASSILHKEISEPRWDEKNKMLIRNSDINGMYAEASFCVDWVFYGKRNNAAAGDDPKDVYPDKFHKALIYYIEKLQKPMALDYFSDERVDNNVIGGYTMKITKDTTPQTFLVTTTLKAHNYDLNINDKLGTATPRTFVYQYRLKTDANGEIVSGEWLSANPDFLWVPLAQKKCGRENPNINHAKIAEMVNTLPPVLRKEDAYGIVKDVVIPKSSPLDAIKITPVNKPEMAMVVDITSTATDLYIWNGSNWVGLTPGTQTVNYAASGAFDTVKIYNNSRSEAKVKVELKAVSYLNVP